MCFLLSTREGAVNTAFVIFQVSRNAKWIFTETHAFGKSAFPPQRVLFSCCSKLWTFACLGIVSANVLYTDEVKGCISVQDLALGPPCEQVSWPTCVWVSLVTAHHLPIVWVCFHVSARAFVLFGSGLVLRFIYLVLCSCIVLEKWYLHIKCFSCAVWLQKALGAMGSDLKWVWIKPALHCCECRKEELNLRWISPPYITPTCPPSIWPLSTGCVPWVLVASL